MANLNPAPAQLGLASPALGPWFDDASLSLAAPGATLAVAHSFAASGSTASTAWWAPAGGTLSLAVSTPTRPPLLRGLTDATGAPAFADDRLVALFRLLPEVEERLEVLSAMLPRPDGVANAGGLRARARVRALAIEYADAAPSRLDDFVNPLGGDAAAAFGLVEGDDGTLGNGALAMTDLKQPGQTLNLTRQVLANFADGLQVNVWAFDADGHAIDPGAVAAWWAAMAGGSVAPWNNPDTSNLWAETAAAQQRTCAVANHLGVRLVNPHRGPIDSSLTGRLTLPPTNATQVGGTGTLYTASQTQGAAISFSAAPTGDTPDTVPIPMAALLPIGTYTAPTVAAPLRLWQAGPVTLPSHGGGANLSLARDFVEVSVLDVESFVCGTLRGPSTSTGTPAARRAADQNRASTRINVRRSTLTLQTTIDGVAAAFNALPVSTATTPVPLVIIAPAFDHDWGARLVDGLPAAAANLPTTLPALQVFALTGGGEADGSSVGEQQVVIRLTVPNSNGLAGAWVRIYPQKINLDTGRREPRAGGAGRFGGAAASGNVQVAHVVVTLPPGRTDGNTPLGVDVMLYDGIAAPLVYADQRITRPAPVGGEALDWADIADALGSSARVLDCDQGTEFDPTALPQGSVRSGATLLARVPGGDGDGTDDRFTLIERASVPLVLFGNGASATNGALAKLLRADDQLLLTTPAFAAQARGNTNPFDGDRAAATGWLPQVSIQPRNGILTLGTAGAPLPTLERLELVGLRDQGTVPGAQQVAVVGSAAALSAWHELLPTQAGNPTAPGGKEVHGAGVQITGGVVTDVAEFVRDRQFAGTPARVSDAGRNALPAQTIATPAPWAAVLKTVARGVEGEPLIFEALDLGDRTLFSAYDAVAAVLPGLPATDTVGDVNAALRAASRRVLNALGRQEALFALDAAIGRAERLIYIETPAIDGEAVDADGANLAWLDTLITRLGARAGLHLALCVPRELLPGTPQPLALVRNELWHQALARLLADHADRVAVFAPGAGPFSHARMASTVVVVDDVWAMVGNTHLWRRGLSFDSSLAVAVFDEANLSGRGAAVSAFRVQLAADRMGVAATQIPLIGHEFVGSIKRLVDGGGAGRLALGPIPRAKPGERPTESDLRLWNRDGSVTGDLDLAGWLAGIAVHVTSA